MLFTVPQNFEFVKYFFQSFLTSLATLRSSNFFSLPHSEAFVKNFFQKFLKLASVISAATILGYHILWLLSSVFFISLCGAVLTAPTALLEYQIIPRLSTPFSNFLRFFIFPCIFKAAALSYLSFNIYYSAVLISPSCFPSFHYIEKARVSPRLSYRSSSGCSCSPRSAASIVSGIFVKSAIKEQGLSIALSCPNGTK